MNSCLLKQSIDLAEKIIALIRPVSNHTSQQLNALALDFVAIAQGYANWGTLYSMHVFGVHPHAILPDSLN